MDWKLSILVLCLLWVPNVLSLDVSIGCEVQNSLRISPLEYDSVRFEAYIQNSSAAFKATVTCEGSRHFDTLKMTRNYTVCLERMHHDSVEFEPTKLESGWHNFDLRVVDQYSLKDNMNHSWIPEGIRVDCSVTEVTITEGLLMRHCLEGAPAWRVSGSQGRDLPLAMDQTQEENEVLTLFSSKEFLPTFEIGKTVFLVGWMNNSIKVVAEGDVEALPPFKHYTLFLKLTTDHYKNQKVFVSDDIKTLFSSKLKEKPSKIRVSGRQEDKFIVLQKLNQGELNCGMVYWETFFGLIGGLILSTSILVCLIAKDIKRCKADTKGKATTTMRREPTQCTSQGSNDAFHQQYLTGQATMTFELPVYHEETREQIYANIMEYT